MWSLVCMLDTQTSSIWDSRRCMACHWMKIKDTLSSQQIGLVHKEISPREQIPVRQSFPPCAEKGGGYLEPGVSRQGSLWMQIVWSLVLEVCKILLHPLTLARVLRIPGGWCFVQISVNLRDTWLLYETRWFLNIQSPFSQYFCCDPVIEKV